MLNSSPKTAPSGFDVPEKSHYLDPYIKAFYILLCLLLLTWLVSTCGHSDTPKTSTATPADLALSKAKNIGSNVVETLRGIAQPEPVVVAVPADTGANPDRRNGQYSPRDGLVDIQQLMFSAPESFEGTPTSLTPGSPVGRIVDFMQDPYVEAPQTFILQDLAFESGSSRLTSESQQITHSLASVIKAYKTMELRLDGHTDNVGNPESNKSLSAERALAVMQALVSAGADALRLSANGFGAERPIDDNATVDGQRANRRVEVVVLSK